MIMDGSFGSELAKANWKLLFFLEQLYGFIEEREHCHTEQKRTSWYTEETDDGDREGSVYFKLKRSGALGHYPLSVDRYIRNGEFYHDLPIWIFVVLNSAGQLFESLKEEFLDAVVDEESWGLGLHLPFDVDTSDEQIAEFAKAERGKG